MSVDASVFIITVMFRIALRDLQWRARRVVIAAVGAALVIALALVMSGLSAGFDNESARTVRLARAMGWVIDQGGTGPFLQPTPLTPATVAAIEAQVGVEHAAPMLFGRQSVRRGDGGAFPAAQHVNLVGVVPGRLGSPLAAKGAALQRDGEAVADVSLGVRVGQPLRLGTRTFTVVGHVRGARLLAGVPNVYVTLHDARVMAFGGQQLTTAVAVDRAVNPPAGTKVLSNGEAKTDGLRPVVNAVKTITMVRSLLWLVAALIVGSVMYLGVLERTKDVAVLKGMGARSPSLLGSLAIQAAILCLGASLLGSALAVVLAPLFPLQAEIPSAAFIGLPFIALAVGVVASLGAARRLLSVQPALAFGS